MDAKQQAADAERARLRQQAEAQMRNFDLSEQGMRSRQVAALERIAAALERLAEQHGSAA